MKYLLVAQIDAPEKLFTWEILPAEHDVSEFFHLAIADLKSAKIEGFTLARLDGPDLTEAIANCRTVAEGLAVAELLAGPS